MNILAFNQAASINTGMNIFDIVLAVVTLGTGLFSMIKPQKAWFLFQSKKLKQNGPTDKTIKTTRYFGIGITVLALAFIWLAFVKGY